ncbi:hypothetical protein M2G93_17145 [Vibrio vulnificus]|uniref:hypothetical protein n=1 Tax=Vibrio vulnificus TaxID=672 RepID=UPI0021DB68D9|nr:hypothetical protein [Vibrio vulnificus]EKZ9225796.1 hypothetical protein [Vibrio vulnificus]ELC9582635.1 hypothetical protein [Vibrio vulnificus]MCU8149844.1 hypothetical protein [Vibrio vulnificus]MCU8385881.1 hypothetical protein [Vibrio vulnificus]
MNNEYGEVVEVYTTKAVLQLQREVKVRNGTKKLHTIRVTIAPIFQGRAHFNDKISMQLEESHLATFCQSMMGLLKNIRIDGAKIAGEKAKVLFININPDETVNLNMSDSESGNLGKSIIFSPDHRYVLLRLAASQLTLNSQGYEQTIADTLNLLKASVIGRKI